MSGVAGIIGKVMKRSVADSLLDTMRRRGPGDKTCIIDADCCLLHTDIAENAGMQPMHYTCEEENYTILYDGRLYNAEDVRQKLKSFGHCFDTRSDTEVILRAYAQWKEKCLDLLNGIFSFAIWHSKERKLFVARDRIGVKPLFYKVTDEYFFFASEIKTILAHPDIPAEIDNQGVAQLLLLGPGRIPGSGVFKDIYELKPGHYGVYSNGQWMQMQYWKLTDREHTDNFEQTAEHVRFLLVDAIERQMDGVEQFGTFLSGGLDSSIISSVCADIYGYKGGTLQTFSVDYENNDKYFISNKFQPESDRYYIDLMQRTLGSKHLDVILTSDVLIDSMDEATMARDLPGMADVDFSLLAFSRRIREHVPIAFSGECADEIFGGYPWYTDPQIRSAEGFPWALNTGFRAGFIQPEFLKELDPNEFVMDHYMTTVNASDVQSGTGRLERRMKELVNLNFWWFMQTLLDRNDRMTMYHGLEVRVPFCDYRIAEYLYGVPWNFKDYGNREKGLLRYAMRGILPEEVLYRKKCPYPKTYDPRYLQLVTQKLQEVIADPHAPLLQLVKKESLEKLLTTEFSWPWYGQLMKLPQTIAYMLQINRWMLLYHVKIV